MVKGKTPAGDSAIQAVSFEALIMDRPLRFDPPLAEASDAPGAFEYWWKLLQYVFELGDPRSFPALTSTFDTTDLLAIRRYIAAGRELAESTILADGGSMTIHIEGPTGPETIESSFAKNEAQRAFAVLFRQFYSTDESASFKRVQNILNKAARRTSAVDDANLASLAAWNRAHQRLLGTTLKLLVYPKIFAEHGWTAPECFPEDHEPTPQELISAFSYGDLIHWGEKRDAFNAWQADPYKGPAFRLAFLAAATGLSHLYIGFSLLSQGALGEQASL